MLTVSDRLNAKGAPVETGDDNGTLAFFTMKMASLLE
jgi:hypothetical protein